MTSPRAKKRKASTEEPATETASNLTSDKRFLHIYQGFGGVYDMPVVHCNPDGTTEWINAIGTSECVTCLGVFFPVGQNRCFVAHIDPHVYTDDDSTQDNGASSSVPEVFQCTEAQGQALHATLVQKLTTMFPQFANGRYPPEWRDRVILVCPRPDPDGQRGVGWHALGAFKVFLGLSDEVETEARKGQGFLVDFSTDALGKSRKLGWESQEPPADADWRLPAGKMMKNESFGEWIRCNPKSWMAAMLDGTWYVGL